MGQLPGLRHYIRSLTQTKSERRHALVGPAHLWKMKRDFQIKFLKKMDLKPDHYLLEIGCGTLRGGIPIIEYLEEGHYFGVEIRPKALEEGKKELKESGLLQKNPKLLLHSDLYHLNMGESFDYIWAFSVLIHMSDEILNGTLSFVSRHLSKDGAFYANVNIGEKEDGNWQGFPVVERSYDFYNKACQMNGLIVSDLGTLKKHGHLSNTEGQDNQRMLKIISKN